jgi:hypothetical protein
VRAARGAQAWAALGSARMLADQLGRRHPRFAAWDCDQLPAAAPTGSYPMRDRLLHQLGSNPQGGSNGAPTNLPPIPRIPSSRSAGPPLSFPSSVADRLAPKSNRLHREQRQERYQSHHRWRCTRFCGHQDQPDGRILARRAPVHCPVGMPIRTASVNTSGMPGTTAQRVPFSSSPRFSRSSSPTH